MFLLSRVVLLFRVGKGSCCSEFYSELVKGYFFSWQNVLAVESW